MGGSEFPAREKVEGSLTVSTNKVSRASNGSPILFRHLFFSISYSSIVFYPFDYGHLMTGVAG